MLSQGDSGHQSVDVTGISKDIYLEITSTTNKYTVADITDQYAFLLGDMDRDGELSINDVSVMIDLLLVGGYTPDDLQVGDIDGDGELSISDVVALVDILIQ